MASPQIIALLEQALALAKTAPAVEVEAVEPETEAETKMTPTQKLDKQLETAEGKLAKLSEKIAGGKSKNPDKDEADKTKLEEVITNIKTKKSELLAKEAKKVDKKVDAEADAKPKPAKATAKKVAEKAPEKAVEAKKNVPRITPAMTTLLKAAFETAEVEWDDKFKKEFVAHANSLSEKDYGAMTLEGHCSKFASMQSEDDAGEETTQPPSGGGGSIAAAAAPLKVLKVSELQKHFKSKNLDQVSAGVFKLKKTGETVTGPHEVEDGDYEERSVDGEIYMVCTATERVYKPTDGVDEFVGFWGVGEW